MQNTKLINLLKTFSRDEFRDFEKFIHSPFHSQKRDVTPYFNVLKDFYPQFNHDDLTAESIFKRLYPRKKYDEARIRTHNSFLFKMAKDFLVQLAFSENQAHKDILLLDQFRKRNLRSSFESLAGSLKKDITSDKLPLFDFFSEKLKLNQIIYEYDLVNNDIPAIAKDINDRIEMVVSYFLGGYLRTLREEIILNIDYGPKLDSKILDRLKSFVDIKTIFPQLEKESKDIELLSPVYYIYLSLESFPETQKLDKKSLAKAKDIFFRNIDRYSRDGKFWIFNALFTIYNVNTRMGMRDLIDDEFELVKLYLEHHAYSPSKDSYLESMQFRNLLLMGLDIKDYDWTENFIIEYSKFTHPDQRKNLMHFAMALLEYRKGNPGKALENSVKVKYDNFIFKRDLKLILLRLFYEEGLYEQARYFLDTSKKYNRSTDDLSEMMKQEDSNFLTYYGKLLKLNDKPDKTESQLTIDNLNKEEKITNKAGSSANSKNSFTRRRCHVTSPQRNYHHNHLRAATHRLFNR